MRNILAIILLLLASGCKRNKDKEIVREPAGPYDLVSGTITSDQFIFPLPDNEAKSVLVYVSNNGADMHQLPFRPAGKPLIDYMLINNNEEVLVSSAVVGGYNAYTAMLYRERF